jgi:hypothetical protein
MVSTAVLPALAFLAGFLPTLAKTVAETILYGFGGRRTWPPEEAEMTAPSRIRETWGRHIWPPEGGGDDRRSQACASPTRVHEGLAPHRPPSTKATRPPAWKPCGTHVATP